MEIDEQLKQLEEEQQESNRMSGIEKENKKL